MFYVTECFVKNVFRLKIKTNWPKDIEMPHKKGKFSSTIESALQIIDIHITMVLRDYFPLCKMQYYGHPIDVC